MERCVWRRRGWLPAGTAVQCGELNEKKNPSKAIQCLSEAKKTFYPIIPFQIDDDESLKRLLGLSIFFTINAESTTLLKRVRLTWFWVQQIPFSVLFGTCWTVLNPDETQTALKRGGIVGRRAALLLECFMQHETVSGSEMILQNSKRIKNTSPESKS